MEQKSQRKYAIDNASLLFLSLMRKDHTNAFRFTMTLTEEICPETLQMAVDRVYRRFPTVIAGFYPGFSIICRFLRNHLPRYSRTPACCMP